MKPWSSALDDFIDWQAIVWEVLENSNLSHILCRWCLMSFHLELFSKYQFKLRDFSALPVSKMIIWKAQLPKCLDWCFSYTHLWHCYPFTWYIQFNASSFVLGWYKCWESKPSWVWWCWVFCHIKRCSKYIVGSACGRIWTSIPISVPLPLSENRVLTTQALYTRISVCSVSLLLFHTIFVNVDMVIATLPIHLFSSVSRMKEPEIIEPR